MKRFIGWYSRRQENLFAQLGAGRVVRYRTADGEAELTEIREESTGGPNFDDAVSFGEVGGYLGWRQPVHEDPLEPTPAWRDEFIAPFASESIYDRSERRAEAWTREDGSERGRR